MIAFRTRTEPLIAAGVVAGSPAVISRLTDRLRDLKAGAREPLEALEVSTGPGTLLLLGPYRALPWVPGLIYVAPAPGADGLWLPTWLESEIPLRVLEAALRSTFKVWTEPLLWLPESEGPRCLVVQGRRTLCDADLEKLGAAVASSSPGSSSG